MDFREPTVNTATDAKAAAPRAITFPAAVNADELARLAPTTALLEDD
jgi:hypothetical protein